MFPPEERPEDEKVKDVDYTNYDEGIYVGYRHFDKQKLEVSYPFGYGLSYTDFTYKGLNVAVENDTIQVDVEVKNIGEYAGKEVVQVYAEKLDSQIDRPLQELKSFAKTKVLTPGESQVLSMKIPVKELSYWDENKNNWILEKGTYKIKVGASSRDIQGETIIEF